MNDFYQINALKLELVRVREKMMHLLRKPLYKNERIIYY